MSKFALILPLCGMIVSICTLAVDGIYAWYKYPIVEPICAMLAVINIVLFFAWIAAYRMLKDK